MELRILLKAVDPNWESLSRNGIVHKHLAPQMLAIRNEFVMYRMPLVYFLCGHIIELQQPGNVVGVVDHIAVGGGRKADVVAADFCNAGHALQTCDQLINSGWIVEPEKNMVYHGTILQVLNL